MLKEPRFWITGLIIVAAAVLAVFGKINGDAFAALVVGLLARWGTDKATPAVTKAIIPLALCGAMLSGCCHNAICYLDKSRVALEAADRVALDLLGDKCLSEAMACGKVGKENCPGWVACDEARTKYKVSVDAAMSGLGTANTLLYGLGVK